MKNDDSDSMFPFGIGASFVVSLVSLISLGALAGYLLEGKWDAQQLGGVPRLIIVLVLLAGPLLYNRKESRFESGKEVLERCDGIGTVQGLRGAFFRLLPYENVIEIRAFYHRYYIPFDRMMRVTIDEGFASKTLNIVTGMDGVPDHIVSTGKQFFSLARRIEARTTSHTATSADAKRRHG